MRHVTGRPAFPVVNLGRLEFFDTPSGAFPVPWGSEEEEKERMRRRGMGQAEARECEPTREGGTRCSDGTYHPPGCPTTPGAQGTVQAAPPGAPFPVLPVAAGVAAAGAAAYLLLSGPRIGQEIMPMVAPKLSTETAAELRRIADNITSWRSSDAFYFQKYIEASRRRQNLVFDEKDAETKLREQERLWGQTHRNLEQLQAAQANFDRIQAEKTAAATERDEARREIETAAQNILIYRHNADVIIAGLSEDQKVEAQRIIDPCFRGPALKGSSRFEGVSPEEYLRKMRLSGRGIPARPLGVFY